MGWEMEVDWGDCWREKSKPKESGKNGHYFGCGGGEVECGVGP